MIDAREIADLVERLRGLAASRHDDLSIGDEAADALEALSRSGGVKVKALEARETQS